MTPTPAQLRAGVDALHAATEFRSVKRDPEHAVARVYEAMTADAVMLAPTIRGRTRAENRAKRNTNPTTPADRL